MFCTARESKVLAKGARAFGRTEICWHKRPKLLAMLAVWNIIMCDQCVSPFLLQ